MPWIKSCLCIQEKKKPFTVSPPIHLLLKNDDNGGIIQGPSHAFRCKTFKKPRPCHLCHQPIINEGSCCKVCEYVCHKVCESKEAILRYTDTSWRIFCDNQKKNCSQLISLNNDNNNNKKKNKNDSTREPLLQQNDDDDDLTLTECENSISENENNTMSSNSFIKTNENKNMDKLAKKKVVQIETVEVLYEPIRCRRNNISINDADNEMMLKSSSSCNGYGEQTLTIQPKAYNTRKLPSTTLGVGGGEISGGLPENNITTMRIMDLSYITERIISLWFPSSHATRETYRQGQRQAAHMLKSKYGDNYMVFNLSEPGLGAALRNEHKFVKELGWNSNLAPPLERLCSICKEIDSWLSSSEHKIAVLHSRGESKEKVGVIVAAYMHYSNICGTAEQALDRFSMRKFLEENIGPLKLPSNKRYVDYFAGLLSHNIKINASPLYLTHVTVHGSPDYQYGGGGGCKAFLKIYEGQNHIYTSGVYSVSKGLSQFTVNVAAAAGDRRRVSGGHNPNVAGLQLHGDILIKCYHYRGDGDRETIFACQFHTCAVHATNSSIYHTLCFTRQDLDYACNDPRFPSDGAVEFHFSSGTIDENEDETCRRQRRHPVAPAPTPAVPYMHIRDDDPVIRADSPFNTIDEYFDCVDGQNNADSDDVNHTFGPLDGSIYATVAKKQPEELLTPETAIISRSPLTVSMDSGISSAGHQQNTGNTNISSSSGSPTAQPSPLTSEEDSQQKQHRELDELLSDMMQTVQGIPDFEPAHTSCSNKTVTTREYCHFDDNISFIDDVDENGGQNNNNNNNGYNRDYQKSPKEVENMQNNYSYMNSNSQSSYSTMKKYHLPLSQRNSLPRDNNGYNEKNLLSQTMPRQYRGEYLRNNDTKRYDTLNEKSFTDGEDSLTLLRQEKLNFNNKTDTYPQLNTPSPYSDLESLSSPERQFFWNYSNKTVSPSGGDITYGKSTTTTNSEGTTWLQRQQQKLKARKEIRQQEERQLNQKTQLFTELKHAQAARQMKSNASYRLDGYTSDTTMAFADDDSVFSIPPLHINTTATLNRNGTPTHYEQYTTWRSQSVTNDLETSPSSQSSASSPRRPQTPAFPVLLAARTPTPYYDLNGSTTPSSVLLFAQPFQESQRLASVAKSPTTQRKDSFFSSTDRDPRLSPDQMSQHQCDGSLSPTSSDDVQKSLSPTNEVVKIVRDTSKYWYKPNISRDEAIKILLRNHASSPPGTFIVRDSNSFPGAFGLVLKVAPSTTSSLSSTSPATGTATAEPSTSNENEMIRHYLIEPTLKGVRITGCSNEPVFSSLSALIYQHSITQIALPCKLILPDSDEEENSDLKYELTKSVNQPQHSAHSQQIQQGAACNVLYLYTLDMESLTGPQAVRKAVIQLLLNEKTTITTAIVHFKVNNQGITLTDNKRKLFFRKHYPINTISYCGLDPQNTNWLIDDTDASQNGSSVKSSKRIFGFIAKKQNGSSTRAGDNQCHLFAELDQDQPATAIVNFINKVLASNGGLKSTNKSIV